MHTSLKDKAAVKSQLHTLQQKKRSTLTLGCGTPPHPKPPAHARTHIHTYTFTHTNRLAHLAMGLVGNPGVEVELGGLHLRGEGSEAADAVVLPAVQVVRINTVAPLRSRKRKGEGGANR